MRAEQAVLVAALLALHGEASGQSPVGRVLGACAAEPTVSVKAWNPSGSIRLVGWDKDSVVVRGTLGRNAAFIFDRQAGAIKLGAEGRTPGDETMPSQLVVYVPKGGTVAVKTVSADIVADAVGGWFYTVSGSMRLSGHAASIDAESMTGSLDLDVATPWIKARTGVGHVVLGGEPQAADVSTISGTLDVATSSVLRGQFSSVSGDIRYAADPAPAAIVELSNHSGGVDLFLPAGSSAALVLSSIAGSVENGFPQVQPAASSARSMRITLGRGDAQLTVRTFKGTIRVRPR